MPAVRLTCSLEHPARKVLKKHLLIDEERNEAVFAGQCHFKSAMIFLQFLKQFYSRDGATLSIEFCFSE